MIKELQDYKLRVDDIRMYLLGMRGEYNNSIFDEWSVPIKNLQILSEKIAKHILQHNTDVIHKTTIN